MTPAGGPTVPTSAAPHRKSVLFCPECGRESLLDGDWTVRTTQRQVAYECPDCGTVLTNRPRREPSPTAVAVTPYVRTWTTWARFWTPWLGVDRSTSVEIHG